MIIYKYQYEKECVLKKTHCYWCLNNCSVREMERGGKMRIIFSHCVLWGGKKKKKKKAVNRTHLTRLKQWSQGQDKNSTSLSLPLFLCSADKTTNKYIIRQFAVFFAASRIICRCCRSLSVKRQRRECLTMQTLMIKTGKSVCLQKWFFFFFPFYSCVCLLICLGKRSCICISNTHIWRGWFKCQDANWWQSPQLKSIGKKPLLSADIKTKPTAAMQTQYKYIFIVPASLLPPPNLSLPSISLF